MSGSGQIAPATGGLRGVIRRLSDLPAWAEPAIWIFLILSVVAIRVYLAHLVPLALWSKDAGSYSYSAFRWIHVGIWETDARRGPIYSMLIAFCGKLWGNIYSIMVLQHIMGGFAVLLSIYAMRLMHGRRALLPLAFCGYAYAVHGLPVYIEHLVRNETVLFFTGTLSLVSWFLAIRSRQWHWLWITGAMAGILAATKNVWFPFPIIFAVVTLWYFRRDLRAAIVQVIIFAIAFVVPFEGAKIFKHRTLGADRSDEPQEGVLFYGRTAQFTKLDGGIYPELKAQIRDQVIAYQKKVFGDGSKPPHLDNNEILKTTVVPHLNKLLNRNGEELNKVCRALALEAVRTHPIQYAEQMIRDIVRMNIVNGARYVAPDDSEISSQLSLLKELDKPDPIIHADQSEQILTSMGGIATADTSGDDDVVKPKKTHVNTGRFTIYTGILLSAWLFDFLPVLLTTLLIPVVWWFAPLQNKPWWVGCAGIWFFTLVLLSTIGRPLDRYLIPALPVMFFTLTSAILMAWNALSGAPEDSTAPKS